MTYHQPVLLSLNLGTLTSWNPLGHSGPVTGLLFTILGHLNQAPVFDLTLFTAFTSHWSGKTAVLVLEYLLYLTLGYESDVWLTVHRNSVWIRKTN